ncbi:DUF3618 domain-containing protein [Mongoliimonas terrestris]|uniref:DUF3618 domain-containing protein n=1 Tax=Mongoliimonas terrestris TaxID=1709001 RepID=UPI000949510E|nr:DUF3618 domain-containing protein [Mongoliimonas terrestris]
MSTTYSNGNGHESQDPDRIESEVEEARARLSLTLDQIRERMSPGQILDQVLDYSKDSGGGMFAKNLGRQVRDNPLPILLIGAGISWLMTADRFGVSRGPSLRGMGASHDVGDGPEGYGPSGGVDVAGSPREGMGSRMGHAASGLGTSASNAYGNASARASSVASGAGERVSSAYSAASDRASSAYGAASDRVSAAAGGVASGASHLGASIRDAAASAGGQAQAFGSHASEYGAQARQSFGRLIEDQPLVLGAIGLAVGAALGAILPSTRTEDRMMGDTADRMKAQGWAAARDYQEQATTAAKETFDDVAETLNEKGINRETLTDAASAVAGTVKARTDGLKDEVAGSGAHTGSGSPSSGSAGQTAGQRGTTTGTTTGTTGSQASATPTRGVQTASGQTVTGGPSVGASLGTGTTGIGTTPKAAGTAGGPASDKDSPYVKPAIGTTAPNAVTDTTRGPARTDRTPS